MTKKEFLEKVKFYNKDFKEEYNFTISFYGTRGEFGGFENVEIEKFDGEVTEHHFPDGSGTWKEGEKMEGKWDLENDYKFLSDLIHKSDIKRDYNDRGTDGSIEYIGEEKKLYIHTHVIGYTGLSIDDDEWGDDDGELHTIEIN